MQKDSKSLGLIVKLSSSSLIGIHFCKTKRAGKWIQKSKTAQIFREKEFITLPVISNTMSLSICFLRSSNSWNRNSSTVIGEHRPCDYFISRSSKYYICYVLLSGIELIKAGWNHSKRQKSAFLLLSCKLPDCVIIPQLNLACVVRGIISSLKTNLNRPNLKAAFVWNLIKRLMTVSCAKQRESQRKSETLNSADYSHIRVLLICKEAYQAKK